MPRGNDFKEVSTEVISGGSLTSNTDTKCHVSLTHGIVRALSKETDLEALEIQPVSLALPSALSLTFGQWDFENPRSRLQTKIEYLL